MRSNHSENINTLKENLKELLFLKESGESHNETLEKNILELSFEIKAATKKETQKSTEQTSLRDTIQKDTQVAKDACEALSTFPMQEHTEEQSETLRYITHQCHILFSRLYRFSSVQLKHEQSNLKVYLASLIKMAQEMQIVKPDYSFAEFTKDPYYANSIDPIQDLIQLFCALQLQERFELDLTINKLFKELAKLSDKTSHPEEAKNFRDKAIEYLSHARTLNVQSFNPAHLENLITNCKKYKKYAEYLKNTVAEKKRLLTQETIVSTIGLFSNSTDTQKTKAALPETLSDQVKNLHLEAEELCKQVRELLVPSTFSMKYGRYELEIGSAKKQLPQADKETLENMMTNAKSIIQSLNQEVQKLQKNITAPAVVNICTPR